MWQFIFEILSDQYKQISDKFNFEDPKKRILTLNIPPKFEHQLNRFWVVHNAFSKVPLKYGAKKCPMFDNNRSLQMFEGIHVWHSVIFGMYADTQSLGESGGGFYFNRWEMTEIVSKMIDRKSIRNRAYNTRYAESKQFDRVSCNMF